MVSCWITSFKRSNLDLQGELRAPSPAHHNNFTYQGYSDQHDRREYLANLELHWVMDHRNKSFFHRRL
jgi:hypothetical protein